MWCGRQLSIGSRTSLMPPPRLQTEFWGQMAMLHVVATMHRTLSVIDDDVTWTAPQADLDSLPGLCASQCNGLKYKGSVNSGPVKDTVSPPCCMMTVRCPRHDTVSRPMTLSAHRVPCCMMTVLCPRHDTVSRPMTQSADQWHCQPTVLHDDNTVSPS